MKFITVILALIVSSLTTAQDATRKIITPDLPKPVASDCKKAIRINLIQNAKYGPTENAKGFGEQEIRIKNKYSYNYFEEEHNTGWYLLAINMDGLMTMDITPTDSLDDIDFLLFPYLDSAFCEQFREQKAIPVRGNISRGDAKFKGLTGLSFKAQNQFAVRGKGNPYSQFLSVKKGEKYMLIVDNVGPAFEGYTLEIHNGKELEISGTVTDDNNKPIRTEITLVDNKGTIIHKTESGEDGEYQFKTLVSADKKYSLNYYNDSTVIKSMLIDLLQAKTYSSLKADKVVLSTLKAGTKFSVGSINFYGDEARLLPESFPSLQNLAKLMKRNSKMTIRIEGHVNGTANQKLSEDRAQAVLDYLEKEGIAQKRMSIIGFSNSKMLYPNSKDEYEQMMNRRVEINVISVR